MSPHTGSGEAQYRLRSEQFSWFARPMALQIVSNGSQNRYDFKIFRIRRTLCFSSSICFRRNSGRLCRCNTGYCPDSNICKR